MKNNNCGLQTNTHRPFSNRSTIARSHYRMHTYTFALTRIHTPTHSFHLDEKVGNILPVPRFMLKQKKKRKYLYRFSTSFFNPITASDFYMFCFQDL